MCLIITLLAAVTATAVWYFSSGKGNFKLGTLSLIYWGAARMWLVDAVFAVIGG